MVCDPAAGRPAPAWLLAACCVTSLLARARVAAAEPGLWQRIADPQGGKVERLVQRARELLAEAPSPPGSPSPPPSAPASGVNAGARGPVAAARPPDAPDKLGQAESLLRQAAALAPLEFSVVFLLADLQASRGHDADAAMTFERAEPLARLPSQRSACWFRLGLVRSKLGRYREAVASYDQQIALGDADAMAYSNVAELLMVLGRLGEAEERYRDAIRIDERAQDRRGREQSMAFSYYGLGVALDRDRQDSAAREAIGRAVAFDPNSSLLHLAQQPGADVFFIPDGDVFYYLGLAAESLGNRDEAGAAFQEYLARQPKSPWVARARAHVAALTPGRAPAADAPAGRQNAAWRVAAVATVLSQGPVPAPVIDAALKQRPPGWEACLAPYPAPRGHEPLRLAIEIELDANGVVASAHARVAAPLDSALVGRCIEDAVRTRLVVPKPTHARPTIARIEVLLSGIP